MLFCGFGADLNLIIILMERFLVVAIFCCCVRQYQNKCAVIITDGSFASAYSRSDKLIELSVTTNKELYIFFGWQQSMTNGFASFVQIPDAQLHWYSEQELVGYIEANNPSGTWFRLALLETMLFEPYYPLTLETDKKGNAVPSKKYSSLHNPVCGYSKSNSDSFLDSRFPENFYTKGYIKRLRKCHGKVIRELNEVLKTALRSVYKELHADRETGC